MHYSSLSELTRQHKAGQALGIYAVCSANPHVIRAALEQAIVDDSLLLIEATSNQVDQFGGYTGMLPSDFIQFVKTIASDMNFAQDNIIFGGDHLGPNAWQDLPAEKAMANARVLVAEYVKAGFSKIHLDTSMRCSDDPIGALDSKLVAERAADLCAVAEKSIAGENLSPPVYVIGTEVPVPGGSHEGFEELVPSVASDVAETIAIHKNLFIQHGLRAAWDRVIAVVAQPGLEFGSQFVAEYKASEAVALVRLIEGYDSLLFEAHSTDYQLASGLSKLVEDHFAILKVGPQLTYALREAILALAHIESELLTLNPGWTSSEIRSSIISTMNSDPKYWDSHYSSDASQHLYEFFFSLSDRIRYYWPTDALQKSLDKLIQNLSTQTIPLSLISQYLPFEYEKIREGRIKNDPITLMHGKVRQVLETYASACGINKPIPGVNS
ncbi:class II D-tagatose-bisphosphate aldolase, non-catalytic subunit [bacterium]|nr:class II D-tagatose-bisphosphate aldolase, non-catalytic subunit [bacterium]